MKNYSDDDRSQRRINVKKMISLNEIVNKPIKKITFKFSDIKNIKKLRQMSKENGETEVNIILDKKDEILTFQLKDKRKVNTQLIKTLNLQENIIID